MQPLTNVFGYPIGTWSSYNNQNIKPKPINPRAYFGELFARNETEYDVFI